MNTGLLIGIVIVLSIVILLKIMHIRHKVYAVLLILTIFFFYITYSNIAIQENLDITNPKDILKTTKAYFLWLGRSAENIKVLTVNAIKMEWKPKNNTIESYSNKNPYIK